ncbi:MAG: isoprenylcysteine carboxylmethyltransferase family protein [Alphaproteobacteria bacterium]|nr:isoprenylcysteine carboxylmethyltransferase family protein [Alphaproteobacteria bacterium]
MTTPRVAFLSVAASGCFLALPVLALGGLEAFFSKPPLVALALATVAMVVAGLFSAGNLSTGEREDRGNRWVFVAFGVLGVLGAWLPAYTDRRDFLTLDGDGVRWLGVALYVVGGILRLWPVFVLGRRFSGLVAIQPGHTLVTAGIYSTIRNPSYLGMMVLSVGWALAFRSLVGVALALLTLVPLIARIRAEERLLRSQFGHEYEAYCARTWRLVPGVY